MEVCHSYFEYDLTDLTMDTDNYTCMCMHVHVCMCML